MILLSRGPIQGPDDKRSVGVSRPKHFITSQLFFFANKNKLLSSLNLEYKFCPIKKFHIKQCSNFFKLIAKLTLLPFWTSVKKLDGGKNFPFLDIVYYWESHIFTSSVSTKKTTCFLLSGMNFCNLWRFLY